MTESSPPTTPIPASHDPSPAWRTMAVAVAATVVITAVVLAALMLVVRRADWWQGYLAATVAIALAAAASMLPLAFGVRRGPTAIVQMFMLSTAVRGLVALGVSALAVGVGKYPAVATFAILIPYYLALLAVESASLAKAARAPRSKA